MSKPVSVPSSPVPSASPPTLLELFIAFALISLCGFGGILAWFTDMFAIAQVTPGPNVIIVSLIGYHVAGLTGALIATLAMCGPTCVVAFHVGHIWERFKDAPWRAAIQGGLLPISIGLIAASAFVVASVAVHNLAAVAMTTAVISYTSRLNPLWVFAAAAVLGLAGLL